MRLFEVNWMFKTFFYLMSQNWKFPFEKLYLELCVGLPQAADLLDAIAADRVRHVLLGVLEPGVEGGRLLGERQIQLLNLGELGLDLITKN